MKVIIIAFWGSFNQIIDKWEIPIEDVMEIRRELNVLVVELKNGKSLRTEKPIKFE